jgi:hypothetical protein
MISGLNTSVMSATLSSAMGVPSFAKATGRLAQLLHALALALVQAQHHVDLVAVGRGPVGGGLAVDIGAQAAGQLRGGQAQFAHRAGLQPHRIGRQAGLDADSTSTAPGIFFTFSANSSATLARPSGSLPRMAT